MLSKKSKIEADMSQALYGLHPPTNAIRAGRLRIVLQKFEQPPLPIHIVYPTSRLLSAKVRTFIDLVTEISGWHFGGK